MKFYKVAFLLALASSWFATPSMACAVCFGAPGSDMSEVASKAILFMLGVVGFILSSIALFAFSLWRRAKALNLNTQTASSL